MFLASIMLLTACQPKSTPEIVEVTVPVEETVLVTQPPKVIKETVLITHKHISLVAPRRSEQALAGSFLLWPNIVSS